MIANDKPISLNIENVLLRGCMLKNTAYVYGIVIYNGHFCRIMKNNIQPREKKSKIEQSFNNYIFFVFLFLIFFCVMAAGINKGWEKKEGDNHPLQSGNLDSDFRKFHSYFHDGDD